jgi:hypothetical protein
LRDKTFDDRSAAGIKQSRDLRLQAQEQAPIVDGVGSVQQLKRGPCQRRGLLRNPGDVRGQVQCAEPLDGSVNHLLDRVPIRDIGPEELGLAANGLDLFAGLFAGFGVEVSDEDCRSVACEPPGGSGPHTERTAGHNTNLVLETHDWLPSAAGCSGQF